jgi:hypothetical protein
MACTLKDKTLTREWLVESFVDGRHLPAVVFQDSEQAYKYAISLLSNDVEAQISCREIETKITHAISVQKYIELNAEVLKVEP